MIVLTKFLLCVATRARDFSRELAALWRTNTVDKETYI